jgi:rubrerythrin
MAIANRDELQQHLRWAMRIEMLTIPPYLYAMYSLEDQDADPAAVIRSVVAEEMLHLALAANLLLGVGGSPRFYDRELITS